MGGLSKKAYQFTKLLRTKQTPSVIVDGGGLLFKNAFIAKGQEEQDKTTAEGIVKAYNLIGYDAVAVNTRDLAAGLDFLLNLQEISLFSWLSANLVDAKSGKTLFKPAVSVTTGDINIAIIGLTDSRISGPISQEIRIKRWQDTLPGLIPELEDKHQIIILLTSIPERECLEIARQYPSIKLIIQASDSSSNRPPKALTPSTLIASTGKQGKQIGIMDITWQPNSIGWDNKTDMILAGKVNKLDRLNNQLSRYKDNPAFLSRRQAIQSQIDRLGEEITVIKSRIAEMKKGGNAFSTYNNRFIALEKSMPDHQTVLEVVNEIKRLINLSNKPSKTPNNTRDMVARNKYTGWKSCQKCHQAQVTKWQSTRHASAFLTLVERSQQLNLDCLPCHVTGANKKEPSSALILPPALQQVGCEACHGPGQDHVLAPRSTRMKPVNENTCLSCHTPERDVDFDFISHLKRIKCPLNN